MSFMRLLDQELRDYALNKGIRIEDRTDMVSEEAVAFINISKPGE